MRTEVMRSESQADDQSLVTENRFIITKNRVSKLGMEARECLRFLFTGLDKSDLDGVISVAGPWTTRFLSAKMELKLSGMVRHERDNYSRLRSPYCLGQEKVGNP